MNKTRSCEATADGFAGRFYECGRGGLNSYRKEYNWKSIEKPKCG